MADTAQKAWILSSGSDNFSRVAEIPPDDDTSYVASATQAIAISSPWPRSA